MKKHVENAIIEITNTQEWKIRSGRGFEHQRREPHLRHENCAELGDLEQLDADANGKILLGHAQCRVDLPIIFVTDGGAQTDASRVGVAHQRKVLAKVGAAMKKMM